LDWIQSWNPESRCYFAPIGRSKDGYAAAVINVRSTGPNTDNYNKKKNKPIHHSKTIVLRAGENMLVSDLAEQAESKITLVAVLASARQAYTSFSAYIFSKVQRQQPSLQEQQPPPLLPAEFTDLARSSVDDFITKVLSKSPVVQGQTVVMSPPLVNASNTSWKQTLYAAICWMTGTSVTSDHCSALNIAMLEASVSHGMFYPAGGPSALERSLIRVIEQIGGGCVYGDVPILRLSVSQENSTEQCDSTLRGWKIEGLSLNKKDDSPVLLKCDSVICGESFQRVFSELLPTECVRDEVRSELTVLEKEVPRYIVMFWLTGSAQDLEIHSTDFVELHLSTEEKRTNEVTCVSDNFDNASASSHTDGRVLQSGSNNDDVQGDKDITEPRLSINETNCEKAVAPSSREKFHEYVKVWSPSVKDGTWGER
jgi:hypothetical protein